MQIPKEYPALAVISLAVKPEKDRAMQPVYCRQLFSKVEMSWVIPACAIGALCMLPAVRDEPRLALGSAGLSAYFLLCWKRPDIALVVIFALAPFLGSVTGEGGALKAAPADICLVTLFAVQMLRSPFTHDLPRTGSLAIPVSLYLAICLISPNTLTQGASALISIGQMALYYIITIGLFNQIPRSDKQRRLPFFALLVSGTLISFIAIITGDVETLGLNKNGLGSILACSLIIAMEYWLVTKSAGRRRVLAVSIIAITGALVMSLSRGAWLGALSGIAFLQFYHGRIQDMVKISFVVIPLAVIFWFNLPSASRSYAMDFSPDRWNIQARFNSIEQAKEQFFAHPILGSGVGLRKQYDATNVILSTLAETGIVGLAAFLFIPFTVIRMTLRARRSVAMQEESFAILAIAGALTLSRLTHSMVDHYWTRGELLITCAASGMAVGICHALQHNKSRNR